MILTVGQYMEAIGNAGENFRTLGRVYPVRDASGNSVLSMPGHGLADFEIMSGNVGYTLRCPLRSDAGSAARLRALRDREKGFGSRFFTEWSLLEKEIVLFDAAGRPVEVDILARIAPQGDRVAVFLQQAAAEKDAGSVLAAMDSFGELAEWARDTGCGGITARRLLVAAGGKVSVAGFSANDESAMTALAFFFTAAMPGRFADVGHQLISGSAAASPVAERMCAAAAAEGFPEPAQMLAGDVAGAIGKLRGRGIEEIRSLGDKLAAAEEGSQKTAGDNSGYSWREDDGEGMKCVRDGGGWRYVDRLNRPVIDTVWLSAVPFREGRAEIEAHTGKGLIDREGRPVVEPVYEELVWDDYWGVVSVMAEGRWMLLDRDGVLLTEGYYDWLGECLEGLILAQKDGKCGFIDTEGREAVAFLYDDATSFSEGCSYVAIGDEKFLIDSRGNKLHLRAEDGCEN